MSRKGNTAERQVETVENLLVNVANADRALWLIEFRVRKAIDFTGASRLLVPIFDEVNDLRIVTSKIYALLAQYGECVETPPKRSGEHPTKQPPLMP